MLWFINDLDLMLLALLEPFVISGFSGFLFFFLTAPGGEAGFRSACIVIATLADDV